MKRIQSENYKKINKVAAGYCPSCSPRFNDSTPPCAACKNCPNCSAKMKWGQGDRKSGWWGCDDCNETFDTQLKIDQCSHCGIGFYEQEESVSDYGTQNSRGDLTHRTHTHHHDVCNHCGYDPRA